MILVPTALSPSVLGKQGCDRREGDNPTHLSGRGMRRGLAQSSDSFHTTAMLSEHHVQGPGIPIKSEVIHEELEAE